MGSGKKEKTRKEKQGKVGDGMANVKVKGENFYRTGKQAKTLNMFQGGKAQRNASGKITKAASFQNRDKPKARVEPNRKVLFIGVFYPCVVLIWIFETHSGNQAKGNTSTDPKISNSGLAIHELFLKML